MKNITDYKVVLWDFDGVIMDSMPIRSLGFQKVLENYPQEQVEELLKFHEINGGLSRYVKFRYFFEKIRQEHITDSQIKDLADEFSGVMLKLLINEKLLISDSLNYIKNNWEKQEMHIVSGSDEKELNLICLMLNLSTYFTTIHGSPTIKNTLVHEITDRKGYYLDDYILVGDSINDFDAAMHNGIDFCGYNNSTLRSKSANYIEKFSHHFSTSTIETV
jgi:phosphoglycolate phosphatase-like HAD superfamily hydrolase